MKKNRRDFIKSSASMAALPLLSPGINNYPGYESNIKPKNEVQWPLSEGPHTPKMVSGLSINADVKSMRRLKQIGINYVSSVALPGQWVESDLRKKMDRFKSNGLNLFNLMYVVGPEIVLAKPERDKEIEKIQESLKVAGKCGLPNVEYNFYVDRLIDGYFEVEGRGGSGLTGFDYNKVKDLPAKSEIGIRHSEEIWANLTY
ncbi:MAG: mannonate dehydratase, partial [Saprospiraceae bacterium]